MALVPAEYRGWVLAVLGISEWSDYVVDLSMPPGTTRHASCTTEVRTATRWWPQRPCAALPAPSTSGITHRQIAEVAKPREKLLRGGSLVGGPIEDRPALQPVDKDTAHRKTF